MSTPDLKKCICAELEHLKLQFEIIPFEVTIVPTHWSDNLKLSTHTSCQKVALSHITCQNISLLYEFHWDEPMHLKLRFEINFVLLALCFTLVGVIIWKYQCIQTHTHILSEYKLTLPKKRPKKFFFSCPKSQRVHRDFLSLDS